MLSAVKREPLEEDPVVSDEGRARSSSDVATGGVGNMASAMERHIQQTNERLLCIKEALTTPTGFQGAARELLEWCGDPRAFQKVFEQNLIGCLTVVSQVSQKPGFDLDLGYRLLAVCAAQRDKFSPKLSSLLSVWCEDLGRQLLLRHQKTREGEPPETPGAPQTPETPPTTTIMHQKTVPQGPQQSDPSLSMSGWQPSPPSGPPAPQGAQQQLSVVTTVWGVTTTTQSGPLAHNSFNPSTTVAAMPYSQAGPNSGYPASGGGPTKPFQGQMNPRPAGPGYNNFNASTNQMNTGMGPSPMANTAHNSSAEFQSSSALSAAALVAAAATATATATASVVALQGRQQEEVVMNNQYNQNVPAQQFQPGYAAHHQRISSSAGVSSPLGGHMPNNMGSHMNNNAMINMANMPSGVNSVNTMNFNGPMAMNKSPMGMMGMGNQPHATMYPGNNPVMGSQARTRAAPYPNPGQHVAQKRTGQFGMMCQQQYGPNIPGYSPNPQQSYNAGQACVCCSQYPGNPPPSQYGKHQYPAQGPISPSYPSQQQMRSNIRSQGSPYNNQPNHFYQQQMNGTAPQNQYDPHYPNQFNQPTIQRNINYQSLPIPGNPTPPLTPASAVPPPYLTTNADIKPNFSDTKPALPPPSESEAVAKIKAFLLSN